MASSDFINKLKYESMNNNLRYKTSGNRTAVQKINAIRNIIHEYDENEDEQDNTWFGVNFAEKNNYPNAYIDNTSPYCNYSCIDPERIYSGGIFVDGQYDYVLCEKCNCEKNPYCLSVLTDISENRVYRGGEFIKGAYDYVECSTCGIEIDVNEEICDNPPPIYTNDPTIPSLPLQTTKPSDKKPVTAPFCGSCFDVSKNRIYSGGEFIEGAYDYVECKTCETTINLCSTTKTRSSCYDDIDPSRIYHGEGDFINGNYDYVECHHCGGDPKITCEFCEEPAYVPYVRINPIAHKRQPPRLCKDKTQECRPPTPPPPTRTYIDGIGFVNTDTIYDGKNPIPDNTTAYQEGYSFIKCDQCFAVGPNEVYVDSCLPTEVPPYMDYPKRVNKDEIYDCSFSSFDVCHKCNTPALEASTKYKYTTCDTCNPSTEIPFPLQFTNNYILPPEIPPKIFIENIGFVDSNEIFYGTCKDNETIDYNVENIPANYKYIICDANAEEIRPPTPECEKNIVYPNPFKPVDKLYSKPEEIYVNGIGFVNTNTIYDGSNPIPNEKTAYDENYNFVVCKECA